MPWTKTTTNSKASFKNSMCISNLWITIFASKLKYVGSNNSFFVGGYFFLVSASIIQFYNTYIYTQVIVWEFPKLLKLALGSCCCNSETNFSLDLNLGIQWTNDLVREREREREEKVIQLETILVYTFTQLSQYITSIPVENGKEKGYRTTRARLVKKRTESGKEELPLDIDSTP